MSVRKRLQRWWDDLLGRPRWYRDADGTTTKSGLKPARQPRGPPAGLSLTDEPAVPSRAPRRAAASRSAGIDPYANDAGFAKPHSWERIDHD